MRIKTKWGAGRPAPEAVSAPEAEAAVDVGSETGQTEQAEGELLTLAEAARYAGRAPATLRRAMRQQRIPRRYRQGTYGPELVATRADVDAWLAEQAQRVEVQAVAVEGQAVEAPAREGAAASQPGEEGNEGSALAVVPALRVALATVMQLTERVQGLEAQVQRVAEAQVQLEDQARRIAQLEAQVGQLAEAQCQREESEGCRPRGLLAHLFRRPWRLRAARPPSPPLL